jgi:hypothetical protein
LVCLPETLVREPQGLEVFQHWPFSSSTFAGPSSQIISPELVNLLDNGVSTLLRKGVPKMSFLPVMQKGSPGGAYSEPGWQDP